MIDPGLIGVVRRFGIGKRAILLGVGRLSQHRRDAGADHIRIDQQLREGAGHGRLVVALSIALWKTPWALVIPEDESFSAELMLVSNVLTAPVIEFRK